MKAYISVSVAQKDAVKKYLEAMKSMLQKYAVEPLIFVEKYKFEKTAEKEMMQQALLDIGNCDLFLAEVSEKAIGIGIEAGYAKALGKPIIYCYKSGSEFSTTLSGISDYTLKYEHVENLKKQLDTVLTNIIN